MSEEEGPTERPHYSFPKDLLRTGGFHVLWQVLCGTAVGRDGALIGRTGQISWITEYTTEGYDGQHPDRIKALWRKS